jgi:ornithine cyclodeaminase/alanine dehydrogenase-like protein (mu-crystallin family)
MEKQGLIIEIAKDISELTVQRNLIVTATSAVEPVIFADQVQLGTLIISMGADAKNNC